MIDGHKLAARVRALELMANLAHLARLQDLERARHYRQGWGL